MPEVVRSLASERAKFFTLVIFSFCVFLMGGGSRDDIESLIILRPLAVLFLAYALSVASREELKSLGIPFWLLIGLMTLTLVQLVPLPFSVWSELPGRQVFADIAIQAGLEPTNRPLNITPSKGWNSFFALIVPLSALVLFKVQSDSSQKKFFEMLPVILFCSAVIGVLQITGPTDGQFYFYERTNEGSAVGLFANRNHHSIMLASTVVILSWYVGSLSTRDHRRHAKMILAFSSILFLVAIILIIGSRAGLILVFFSILVSSYFIYDSKVLANRVGGTKTTSRFLSKNKISIAFIIFVVGMFALSLSLSRTESIDRLFDKDPLDGLRWSIQPILYKMTEFYFPLGSGFGSFQQVFYQFETMELLRPQYLNHAHNDWGQFVIESGLPGLLILICFIFWFVTRALKVLVNSDSDGRKLKILATVFIIYIGVASLADYPLRVPSIMVTFAICCAVVNKRT